MAVKQETNFFIKLLILLIIGAVMIAIIDMQVKMSDLASEKNELQAEIDKTSDSVEEMKIRLKTPFDEEYMEKLAREKLGYRNPGDRIYRNNIAK